VQSHQRATAAWKQGVFQAETVPITVGSGVKARQVTQDEGFRPDSNLDALAKLQPAFVGSGSASASKLLAKLKELAKIEPSKDVYGTVTAGNASMLSDGAAALAVVSGRAVEQHGCTPLARIVAYATSGIAPKDIFLAPVGAVRQVLAKARLQLQDIDLFEMNEAFAAQMLACNKELKIPEERLNVHGGAIALGHPIGASGARVLVTLVHALQRRGLKYGLAALCLGGGNAVATVVERI
jgi:acetyl-CoA C-acetyltransferase